jgi:hypothetical protein
MATRYTLCVMAIGSPGFIRITKKQYDAYAEAMRILVQLCELEEKFAATIDNYFEFEHGLIEQALRAMIFTEFDELKNLEPKHVASRNLLNLMTAAKLYLDSLPHHADEVLANDPSALEIVKRAPSVAYDSAVEYRVMEALRNVSQHQMLPIQSWTTHSRWNSNVQPNLLEFSVEPSLDLNSLKRTKFKSAVLDELQKDKLLTDLKPHVRKYVELLSDVHEKFRDATKQRCEASLSLLAAGYARYNRKFKKAPEAGIAALPVNELGTRVGDPVFLSPPVVRYLPHLQRRTMKMVDHARRRVRY